MLDGGEIIETGGAGIAFPHDLPVLPTQRYLQPAYRFGKRMVDVFVSLIGIVLLSPIFIGAWIAIALTMGLPVCFVQKRVGKGGRMFTIFKFRSMVKDAEGLLRRKPELWAKFEQSYKLDDDPRVTALGRFLRKSSIDELPQLFNVLRGDMSLVGPRPIIVPELDKYAEGAEIYLQMKPGCTGLWQCEGRSTTSYAERVALDTQYFHRASIRFDLWIILRTFKAVLSARGAQ